VRVWRYGAEGLVLTLEINFSWTSQHLITTLKMKTKNEKKLSTLNFKQK
jgi:hypothetical protein